MHLTLPVPIRTGDLSLKKLQILSQLGARDYTLLKDFIDVIQVDQRSDAPQLFQPKVDSKGVLDQLTLPSKYRPVVPFDLLMPNKDRISAREIKEVRDDALASWRSYRALHRDWTWEYWRTWEDKKYDGRTDQLILDITRLERQEPSPPFHGKQKNKHAKKKTKNTRRINIGTNAWLHTRETKLTKHWLELKQVKTGKTGRMVPRIWLPLNISPYHQNRLALGKLTQVMIYRDERNRWYALCILKVNPKNLQTDTDKPIALVMIDPGIKRSLTAVLLAPDQRKARFFMDKEKTRVINQYDLKIKKYQRVYARKKRNGERTKNVSPILKRLRLERRGIDEQYDHVLTRQVIDWCTELSHTYTVHLIIGDVTAIRKSRYKGDYKSRKHRGMVNRWNYNRLVSFLEYKWELDGLNPDYFHKRKEWYTSKTCHACRSTDTCRPSQSLFICLSCGWQGNADLNAALNIGFLLIESLGLDKVIYGLHGDLESPSPINLAHAVWITGRGRQGSSSRSVAPHTEMNVADSSSAVQEKSPVSEKNGRHESVTDEV